MKYKNVLYTAVISTLCLGITSCSDFLDGNAGQPN